MAENSTDVGGNTPALAKRKRGNKILLIMALGIVIGLPVLALAVGIGIIPQGGTFNPIKTPTVLAADVECLLKFPSDASPDDTLIGSVFDQYIRSIQPKSPLIGLGSAISKSGRGSGVNPTIIVAQARNESNFGIAGKAGTNLNNPFGRRNSNGSYIQFSSYREAIDQHGPYLKRVYLDQGVKTVLDMMNIYAPASDGNDPVGYSQKIGQWSAEMIQLARQNYNNALGNGVCPLPSAIPTSQSNTTIKNTNQ